MKSSNLIMANKPEAGISQEKIEDLHRERKRKEAEKRKSMGCWDCGKKLTTWDYDLGIFHIGQNLRLGVMKKKVAGQAYLCHKCYTEAKVASEEIEAEGRCFFCGNAGGTVRGCGVHLCDECMAPKDITDIMSPNGDGSMVDQDMIAWWRGAAHLQNCVIDAEVFRFTLDTELLARIYGEVGVVRDQGIISDRQREAINEVIKSITEEMKKDENEAGIMAAGLRGVLGDILMQHLYHDHPMKKADIQLEPGVYELEGERPDGLDTFRWTVKDAPVVLKRIDEETHPPADEEEPEDTKETDDDKGD